MMSLRVVKSSFFVFLGLVISLQLFACGNPHYPKKKPAAAPSAEEQKKQNDSLVKTPEPAPSASPTGVTPPAAPSASPTAKPSASPSGKPSAVPSSKPSAVPSNQPSAKPSVKPSASPSVTPSARPTASVNEDLINENKLASCEKLAAFVAPLGTPFEDAIDGTEGTYGLEEIRIQQGLLKNGKWVVLTQLASLQKDVPAKEICSDLLSLEKGKVVTQQISLPQTISRETGAVGALADFTSKMGGAKPDALAIKLGAEPKAGAKPTLISEVGLKVRKKGWAFYVTPTVPKKAFEVFMSFQDSTNGKLITVKALYQIK